MSNYPIDSWVYPAISAQSQDPGANAFLGVFATFASLPAANSVSKGSEVFALNIGKNGSKLRSTGTYWRPVNGNCTMLVQSADITLLANTTEQIFTAAQILFPANFLQIGCIISLWPALGKASSTDTATFKARFGPLGTVSDPMINAFASLATTNLSIGGTAEYQIISATTVCKLGANNAVNPLAAFAGSPLSALPSAPITFGNINTNNTLSISGTMTAGTEVCSMRGLIVEVSFP